MSPEAWNLLTDFILASVAAGLGLYDLVAAWKGGNDATISVRMKSTAHKYPAIPLLIGIAVGHWFCTQTH